MPPHRFTRSQRILSSSDFVATLKHGKRIRDPLFTLHVRPTRYSSARLGLTVGKHAARAAVGRNRIKRLARERFRLLAAELPALDIVLRATPASARANRHQLAAAIDNALRQLRSPLSSHNTLP